jgi:adenylate cyclase class 2
MKTEIEVKFLNQSHDEIRGRLHKLGATCKMPMRLMKRAIIDYPDRRLQNGKSNAYVRVRDEGDKVTLTFKKFESLSINGAKEIETNVESFDDTIAIFTAIGLEIGSFQESKRESWLFQSCSIELDEWPWLKPFIEIEGPSEHAIKSVAKALDLDWTEAEYGDVMVAYRAEYPGLSQSETVGNVREVRFGTPPPSFLG